MAHWLAVRLGCCCACLALVSCVVVSPGRELCVFSLGAVHPGTEDDAWLVGCHPHDDGAAATCNDGKGDSLPPNMMWPRAGVWPASFNRPDVVVYMALCMPIGTRFHSAGPAPTLEEVTAAACASPNRGLPVGGSGGGAFLEEGVSAARAHREG